jgi:hypothetical protein
MLYSGEGYVHSPIAKYFDNDMSFHGLQNINIWSPEK